MSSVDRPGVPYHRRAVNCRYKMCQAVARSNFRPGYRRLQSAFQQQQRRQKRRARVGYHHGDPTCMCCYDSLSGPGPGGTLAIDLVMATIFLEVVRARRFAVSAVADHACLPTTVCTVVAMLVRFRIQKDTRIIERMRTMLEGVVAFAAVEAKPPVFSDYARESGGLHIPKVYNLV